MKSFNSIFCNGSSATMPTNSPVASEEIQKGSLLILIAWNSSKKYTYKVIQPHKGAVDDALSEY